MTRSCPYCGNNPVPHLVFKFNESLNILLTPLRQKLLYNGLTDLMKKHGWDQSLARFFLAFGEKIKILRRQSSEAECEVPRAKVLWQEAERRQIEMNELLLFGRPFDVYVAEKKYPSSFIFHPLPSKIKDKRLKIIFSGLPRPAGYNNKWLDLMDDKWLFKKKLMENNLPAPRGESCSSFSQAVKIFRKVQDNRPTSDFRSSDLSPIALAKGDPPINPIPLIVKPRAGSRGRHSTTFVYKQADLRRAFKIAKQLCYWVMVEEQLFGPVYRATVVNFELCGVLRGDPPQVVGDGVSTVVELIKNKNSNKNNQVKNINIDAAMELFLSRQNLKFYHLLPSAGHTWQNQLLSVPGYDNNKRAWMEQLMPRRYMLSPAFPHLPA